MACIAMDYIGMPNSRHSRCNPAWAITTYIVMAYIVMAYAAVGFSAAIEPACDDVGAADNRPQLHI